jgi:hypothetical protein
MRAQPVRPFLPRHRLPFFFQELYFPFRPPKFFFTLLQGGFQRFIFSLLLFMAVPPGSGHRSGWAFPLPAGPS